MDTNRTKEHIHRGKLTCLTAEITEPADSLQDVDVVITVEGPMPEGSALAVVMAAIAQLLAGSITADAGSNTAANDPFFT